MNIAERLWGRSQTTALQKLDRKRFSSDEEFMNYVAMCKKNSKYTFKEAPEITKDSYIATLSTCTSSDDKRMIVQLVRGEELDIYGNPVNTGEEFAEGTTAE